MPVLLSNVIEINIKKKALLEFLTFRLGGYKRELFHLGTNDDMKDGLV